MTTPKQKMPMSLNSLLQTHPYKKKDCLEFICAKIKIPSNWYTADNLRQKILEYTDNDKEMEDNIKEVAYYFKHKEEKKKQNEHLLLKFAKSFWR